jgi:hypothetical protein
MNGRIVIHIHNEQGELVAYVGRSIEDSEPRNMQPTQTFLKLSFPILLSLSFSHTAARNSDHPRKAPLRC